MKITSVAFTCLTLGGCVTMDASECRDANWQEIGFRDGMYGMQRMDAVYGDRCEKYGTRLDIAAYVTGWQDGHWEYEKRAVRDSTD